MHDHGRQLVTPRCGLVLLVLAGAGWAKSDFKALAAQLKDPKARVAAYRELRAAKDPAAIGPVRRVIEELPDSQRHWGLSVLDVYPADLARRAFRPLLRSPSPFTRLFAAEALHRRGVPNMGRTIHAVLRAPDMHARQKRLMLARLRYGRLPRYRPLIETVRGFLSATEPVPVIYDAAQILQAIDDDGAVKPAVALLKDPRPGARACAAALLVHLGFSEHVKTIATILRSGKLNYELTYVATLLRGLDAVPLEIRKALRELLGRDLAPAILRRLIYWVSRIKDRDAMPALRKLLKHKDPGIRKTAAKILLNFAGRGSAGGTAVPKSLEAEDAAALADMLRKKDRKGVRKWLHDKSTARRLLAADALRRMDDESGLQTILAILADKKSEERAVAAKLLAGFRRPDVVAPLLDALADQDAAVRSSAYLALGVVWNALFPQRVLRMRTTRYLPHEPPAKSAPAVARIRAWWNAHKDGDW